MKYIKQFTIILLITFIGEILNRVIPLTVPAGIYGIVILFVCLELKVIPLSAVRETGLFLVEIMPILFIPAAVGLLNVWDVLRPAWVSYVSITVITTVAVMAVSGRATQAVIRHGRRNEVADDA